MLQEHLQLRQQNLAGLAPQVAGQDALQQQAQTLATQGVGSLSTFFTTSTNCRNSSWNSTWWSGRSTSLSTSVQDLCHHINHKLLMHHLQSLIVNTNTTTRVSEIKQAALGALGSGRAGVQLAELWHRGCERTSIITSRSLTTRFWSSSKPRQQDIQQRS